MSVKEWIGGGTGDRNGVGRPGPRGLSLRLPAQPESVGAARHAVAAFGEELGLEGRRLDDLRTLVSEACANAVTHAYRGRTGELELRVVADRDELAIIVTDEGDGIRPRPASEGSSGRLGLLLMATLASKIEISRRPSGGTELKVLFPLS